MNPLYLAVEYKNGEFTTASRSSYSPPAASRRKARG
jgi:hypothetical protein